MVYRYYPFLIIEQWGFIDKAPVNSYITLPISATPFAVVANDIASNQDPLSIHKER